MSVLYDDHFCSGVINLMKLREIVNILVGVLYTTFRCWKNRTPYDETKYLNVLKKRNPQLLKFAAET